MLLGRLSELMPADGDLEPAASSPRDPSQRSRLDLQQLEAFGKRLRQARLLGSMGSIGD